MHEKKSNTYVTETKHTFNFEVAILEPIYVFRGSYTKCKTFKVKLVIEVQKLNFVDMFKIEACIMRILSQNISTC